MQSKKIASLLVDSMKNGSEVLFYYFFISTVHHAKVGEILHYSTDILHYIPWTFRTIPLQGAASRICGKHISVKQQWTKVINRSLERL